MTRTATYSLLRLAAASVLGALMLAGCALDPDDAPETCRRDAECASDICESGLCVPTCSNDEDCSSGNVCADNDHDTRTCAAPCDFLPDDHVCLDGLPVACSAAPETACETCGCTGTTRCEVGVGCIELLELGDACTENVECASGNCSELAGVCRVAIGQACTTSNCDYCLTAPGFSFCSRECGSEADCNGFHCLGNRITGIYVCRGECQSSNDPACPGNCLFPAGTTAYRYCDCSTCDRGFAPRAQGQMCYAGAQCASEECLLRGWIDLTTGVAIGVATGFCTDSCESDADCLDGTVCAAIPCGAGETGSTCGSKCLRPCARAPECNGYAENGACRSLARVGTPGSVNVCDAKGGAGMSCYADRGCISDVCVGGECAPVGGNPNGGDCTEPGDCASGSCTSGTCRGNALIGGACSRAFDCAVGTCCTSGANEDTCRTSC